VVSWSHFLVMSPRLNRNMCVIEATQERPNEDRAAVATWPAPIKMQYSMRMSRHFRSSRRCHLKPPRLSLQETERTSQYEPGISCAGSPPASRARQLCAACISSCSGSFVQIGVSHVSATKDEYASVQYCYFGLVSFVTYTSPLPGQPAS
jgi:hypothetical protein